MNGVTGFYVDPSTCIRVPTMTARFPLVQATLGRLSNALAVLGRFKLPAIRVLGMLQRPGFSFGSTEPEVNRSSIPVSGRLSTHFPGSLAKLSLSLTSCVWGRGFQGISASFDIGELVSCPSMTPTRLTMNISVKRRTLWAGTKSCVTITTRRPTC
eukprot:IDg15140t1